jgi:hypothetical protein
MAHPDRSEAAQAIKECFVTFDARVIFDPDPSGFRSTIRTAREAWVPWSTDASHHLVLQDDIVLHPNFEDQLVDALAAQPDAIVSFFSEWGSFTSHALRVAAIAGRPFVSQPDTYLGTQAISMRVEDAAQFAAYLARVDLSVPDDHAVWQWAHENGKTHFVTNPNLVDHDVTDSLAGNAFQGVRRSTVYLPSVSMPLGWWLETPLTSLRRLPAMHWLGAEPVLYVRQDGPDEQWTIRPREATWEKFGTELQPLIDRVVEGVCAPSASLEIRDTVAGLTNILADMLALGTSLRVTRDFADGPGIDAAIESLAPGCLRRLAKENPGTLRMDRATGEFAAFGVRARPLIEASMELSTIRALHVDAS